MDLKNQNLFPRRQSEDGQAYLHHPSVPARVAEHPVDVRLATDMEIALRINLYRDQNIERKSDKKVDESIVCMPENAFGVRENIEVHSKCAQMGAKRTREKK